MSGDRRGVALAVAMMIWVASLPLGAAPFEQTAGGSPAYVPERQTAREVRTVWTEEFGLSQPVGLTYDSSRGDFLVAGHNRGLTKLLRLDDAGNSLGSVSLPGVDRGRALIYDPRSDKLTLYDSQGPADVSGADLARNRPGAVKRPANGADLDAPSSAALDGDGSVLVVDEVSNTVSPADRANAPVVNLGDDGDGRLIAFNSSDELIYILDHGSDRLDAYDATGRLIAEYDISSVEMTSPEAMAFGPSTDRTDDESILNLYVADSGDADLSGGITEVSLTAAAVEVAATTETATHIRTILTSQWNPASPDPSGIVWMPGPDQLVVVDSEVDEVTGAGWHNVNMWRTSRTGSVVGTGTMWGSGAAQGGFSREPTGAGYDAGSNSLFVSDDSADAVFVIRPGTNGNFGDSDDVVTKINTGVNPINASDTEDPEFDPGSGHLFVLSGVDREIFRINPVDGVFGNGNDSVSSFDISHLGPTDFEGLTSSPSNGTLFVGARAKSGGVNKIFEISHSGALIRTVNVSISNLSFVSGLAMAPSSTNPSVSSLWIVDRAVDNGANPSENDGKIFEIGVTGLGGGGTVNTAPTVDAGPDRSVTMPASATLSGSVSDDGLPAGSTLTQSWSRVSGPGTVAFADPSAATTTADFSASGSYTLRLTASDGALSASDEMVVTVSASANQPPTIAPIEDVVMSVGETEVVDVTVSDPDGDPVTVTLSGLPSWGSYNPSNRRISLSPDAGAVGTHGPVTVTVNDGSSTGTGQAPAFRSAASAADTGISATTLTIPRPTGVQSGDLLLAQIRYRGSTPNLTAPAGWTVIGTVADSSQANHTILYKIAGANEPTSYGFNQNVAAGRMAGGIGAYTGVDQTDPIAAWAPSASRTSTLVAPSVNAPVTNTRVVRLWGWRGASATTSGVGYNLPPSEVAERWSEQVGGSNFDRNRVLAGDSINSTTGPVGTAVASGSQSSGEQNRSSFTVLLAPASGGSGGLSASTSFNITVTEPTTTTTTTSTTTTTAPTTTTTTAPTTTTTTTAPTTTTTTTTAPSTTTTTTPPSSSQAPEFRSASSAIDAGVKSASLTISKPSGVQAGDLLLAQIRYRGKTPTLTAPDGWTQIGVIPDSSHANHAVYHKIAGANEPGSYTFTQADAAGRMAGGIGAYTGVDPDNPIAAWAGSNSRTSSLTAPSVTTDSANTRVVRLWGWRGPAATEPGVGYNVPPPGVEERWSVQVPHANADRNRVLAGDHVLSAAGPTGTSMASGSQSSQEQNRSSFTVALRPRS